MSFLFHFTHDKNYTPKQRDVSRKILVLDRKYVNKPTQNIKLIKSTNKSTKLHTNSLNKLPTPQTILIPIDHYTNNQYNTNNPIYASNDFYTSHKQPHQTTNSHPLNDSLFISHPSYLINKTVQIKNLKTKNITTGLVIGETRNRVIIIKKNIEQEELNRKKCENNIIKNDLCKNTKRINKNNSIKSINKSGIVIIFDNKYILGECLDIKRYYKK